MSDKAVCRTAPATPGLLNICPIRNEAVATHTNPPTHTHTNRLEDKE